MINRKLFLVPFLVVLLTACNGNLPVTGPSASPTAPNMEEPTQGPQQGPLNNSYLPEPGDVNFSRGEVFINSTDLLIMESFPVQISLVLVGDLPTPCNQLRVVANPPDEQNHIQVEVYSVINPAETCIQMLESFEVNIGLGSFPPGHYTVLVNGEQVGEFDS